MMYNYTIKKKIIFKMLNNFGKKMNNKNLIKYI